MVVSDTTAGSGSDVVNNIVSLTQAEYNAIGSPDATTLYLITDP
jgi:alcohol dehydrogenase class IV